MKNDKHTEIKRMDLSYMNDYLFEDSDKIVYIYDNEKSCDLGK